MKIQNQNHYRQGQKEKLIILIGICLNQDQEQISEIKDITSKFFKYNKRFRFNNLIIQYNNDIKLCIHSFKYIQNFLIFKNCLCFVNNKTQLKKMIEQQKMIQKQQKDECQKQLLNKQNSEGINLNHNQQRSQRSLHHISCNNIKSTSKIIPSNQYIISYNFQNDPNSQYRTHNVFIGLDTIVQSKPKNTNHQRQSFLFLNHAKNSHIKSQNQQISQNKINKHHQSSNKRKLIQVKSNQMLMTNNCQNSKFQHGSKQVKSFYNDKKSIPFYDQSNNLNYNNRTVTVWNKQRDSSQMHQKKINQGMQKISNRKSLKKLNNAQTYFNNITAQCKNQNNGDISQQTKYHDVINDEQKQHFNHQRKNKISTSSFDRQNIQTQNQFFIKDSRHKSTNGYQSIKPTKNDNNLKISKQQPGQNKLKRKYHPLIKNFDNTMQSSYNNKITKQMNSIQSEKEEFSQKQENLNERQENKERNQTDKSCQFSINQHMKQRKNKHFNNQKQLKSKQQNQNRLSHNQPESYTQNPFSVANRNNIPTHSKTINHHQLNNPNVLILKNQLKPNQYHQQQNPQALNQELKYKQNYKQFLRLLSEQNQKKRQYQESIQNLKKLSLNPKSSRFKSIDEQNQHIKRIISPIGNSFLDQRRKRLSDQRKTKQSKKQSKYQRNLNGSINQTDKQMDHNQRKKQKNRQYLKNLKQNSLSYNTSKTQKQKSKSLSQYFTSNDFKIQKSKLNRKQINNNDERKNHVQRNMKINSFEEEEHVYESEQDQIKRKYDGQRVGQKGKNEDKRQRNNKINTNVNKKGDKDSKNQFQKLKAMKIPQKAIQHSSSKFNRMKSINKFNKQAAINNNKNTKQSANKLNTKQTKKNNQQSTEKQQTSKNNNKSSKQNNLNHKLSTQKLTPNQKQRKYKNWKQKQQDKKNTKKYKQHMSLEKNYKNKEWKTAAQKQQNQANVEQTQQLSESNQKVFDYQISNNGSLKRNKTRTKKNFKSVKINNNDINNSDNEQNADQPTNNMRNDELVMVEKQCQKNQMEGKEQEQSGKRNQQQAKQLSIVNNGQKQNKLICQQNGNGQQNVARQNQGIYANQLAAGHENPNTAYFLKDKTPNNHNKKLSIHSSHEGSQPQNLIKQQANGTHKNRQQEFSLMNETKQQNQSNFVKKDQFNSGKIKQQKMKAIIQSVLQNKQMKDQGIMEITQSKFHIYNQQSEKSITMDLNQYAKIQHNSSPLQQSSTRASIIKNLYQLPQQYKQQITKFIPSYHHKSQQQKTFNINNFYGLKFQNIRQNVSSSKIRKVLEEIFVYDRVLFSGERGMGMGEERQNNSYKNNLQKDNQRKGKKNSLSLLSRIYEPYLNINGEIGIWLYCVGTWRLFTIDRKQIITPRYTSQSLKTNQPTLILKSLQRAYQLAITQYYPQSTVQSLQPEQLLKMLTGLRISTLSKTKNNRQRIFKQIQYNIKKSHIVRAVSSKSTNNSQNTTTNKLFSSQQTINLIKKIQNTPSGQKVIQIVSYSLSQRTEKQQNKNCQQKQKYFWIKEEKFLEYFSSLVIISKRRPSSYWSNSFLEVNNKDKAVYMIECEQKHISGSITLYPLSLSNDKTTENLQKQAPKCTIAFYKQIQPQVLKLVGKATQKIPTTQSSSYTSKLYFEFNIKGTYYIFLELENNRYNVAIQSNSSDLKLDFVEFIKKQTMKNQQCEYVEIDKMMRRGKNINGKKTENTANGELFKDFQNSQQFFKLISFMKKNKNELKQ